jgi:hypothetical protein
MTEVVNLRTASCDVYIGRPSRWGNPFRIGPDGNREQVIEKFREFCRKNPELVGRAKKELRGKRLGCWCKPLACHGDVWVELVEESS